MAEREMEKGELKFGLKVWLVGLGIPFVIVNLLAFSSATIAGVHILGWGQLVLMLWIVVVAVFHDRKMREFRR